MKTPRDRLFLGHMLAAMERLGELTARIDRKIFHDDWVLQNAVVRELEIIGEAAGRLSKAVVAAHPEIPWKAMTGIRHKLIHDYFEVDPSVVWTTATVNVPEVLPLIRQALAELAEGDGTESGRTV